jgi:hypothetical protein
MVLGLIAAPVGLVLYGVGIDQKLHWMVPTLGLGFLSFAIAQATNVSLVYTIDAYRPVAGEIVVTQLSFKGKVSSSIIHLLEAATDFSPAAFGFLLSFYTNPWIQQSGYSKAFGTMAGISGAVLLMFIPLYFFGRRIRHATLQWGVMKGVKWNLDREVGE